MNNSDKLLKIWARKRNHQGRVHPKALSNSDAGIGVEQKFLNKLELQKKRLMHDLLTGKVRVKVDTPVEHVPS